MIFEYAVMFLLFYFILFKNKLKIFIYEYINTASQPSPHPPSIPPTPPSSIPYQLIRLIYTSITLILIFLNNSNKN